MDELVGQVLAEQSWVAEGYVRALKQCYHVERCQARSAHAQRIQVEKAIRTFARPSRTLSPPASRVRDQAAVVREAVRAVQRRPCDRIPSSV